MARWGGCALGFATAVASACTPFEAAPDVAEGGGGDASVDAGTDGGGGEGGPKGPVDVTPSCNHNLPFGALMPFPTEINSVATEDGASLSPDGRTLYFSSSRDGPAKLFFASRPSAGGTLGWGAANPLGVLNSGGPARNPSLTSDGLTIVFDSTRGDGNTRGNLWSATRPSVSEPFGDPVNLVDVNSVEEDDEPWITGDGLRLYFTSGRVSGSIQLYVASRSTVGESFGVPALVDGLTSSFNDGSPVLTGDELTMFFGSNRPTGGSGRDVWTAHRTARDKPFASPFKVEELSTTDDDYPTWVSPNGCAIIIERGLNAKDDLFYALRPP